MTEETTPQEGIIQNAQAEHFINESLKEEIPSNQYTTIDENITAAVQDDPDLQPLFPLYSHLMRLTNISAEEKNRYQNNIDLLIGAMEIGMSSRDFDSGKWAKLQSHGIFLKQVPNDSVKGFKMLLLSRNRREISFEQMPKPKKRGLFF